MTLVLDTDTRQMRLHQDGYYRSGGGKNICDHCGWRGQCIFMDETTSCKVFLPAIPFTDETGLERVSNTVRIGKAWTNRLQPGQTVALYNPKTRLIFGHSTVLYTVAGPIIPMLKAHAASNHIMLDTPINEAPAKLGAWLRQNYGPRIVHENTSITAVYVQRLREPPTPAYLQGLEEAGEG